MYMKDLIEKKRDGGALTKEEIRFIINGYTNGDISDYQMSAFLMAVYFMKLNKEETYEMTAAMRDSGDVADLSSIAGVKVDKHSTGGVGDKTTFVVAPIAAACGVPIAKMSGRGLGFTGGTVDKMESIPGFRTSLEETEFMELVKQNGIAVIGQTGHIAPADKKIYALRDVTATVNNLGLITSSIMSKKLASGSDAIVLDVKCGQGAFMETQQAAEELASAMVDIGTADGKKTIAVITDMNQPLGNAVGNSLEVIEAIETLKGNGPEDITCLSVMLAGMMIYAGEKAPTPEEGAVMAQQAIDNGNALKKMKEFIAGQGGDPAIVDDYSIFEKAEYSLQIKSNKSGYVQKLYAKQVGLASQNSGAGRATKDDSIDMTAGILLNKKVGDYAAEGDVLATIYGNSESKVKAAAKVLEDAYVLGNEKPEKELLIKKVIGA